MTRRQSEGAIPVGPVTPGERELLLAVLEESRRAVEGAEGQLEHVLSELRSAPRAEKTAVSQGVEAALGRLKLARSSVLTAEKAISGDPK